MDNITQDYGTPLATFGKEILKALMNRSLEKARDAKLLYLISSYMGQSVHIRTIIDGSNIYQKALWPHELMARDRKIMEGGEYHSEGTGMIMG